MPFEPLQTDEKREGPLKAERDFDAQMLAGCAAFVGTSIITYLLGVWPYFALPATNKLLTLGLASLCGLVPAAIFGSTITRKTGLPGACGFLGGAMAIGIFLFLRLQQVMLARQIKDLPQPEYPASWTWIVPLAWLLICLGLIAFFMPKGQFADEPKKRASQ